MYLAGAIRPNISFATSKLSRFTSNPRNAHWCILEHVMRYLRGTTSYGLYYTGYSDVLEGYSDANWISNVDEIKATSGYMYSDTNWISDIDEIKATSRYIFTIGGAAFF
jgi:hypothetical protein